MFQFSCRLARFLRHSVVLPPTLSSSSYISVLLLFAIMLLFTGDVILVVVVVVVVVVVLFAILLLFADAVTRVRTILVLDYWGLGDICIYWVISLSGDIFCDIFVMIEQYAVPPHDNHLNCLRSGRR